MNSKKKKKKSNINYQNNIKISKFLLFDLIKIILIKNY